MTLKRKHLFVTGISLVLMLAGCGNEDPYVFQDYQPIEITPEITNQTVSSKSDQQEPSLPGESGFEPQQTLQSEIPVEASTDSAFDSSSEESGDWDISVDYASALMYYNPDSYHECILDNSAYATQIGFEVSEPVSDLSVLRLSLNDDSATDELIFDAEAAYTLPELTPDMPLVVSAGFGETIPTLGISFLNPKGDRKVYGIIMSGEDQSILLQEIQLAE